ncbi:hypothetical protein OQZ29_17910 [Pedobacter agri]|uniref:Uncharacterized protein n=2 Tax=Pedobacter agri TaxID=454586 RepID=A0A9X3IBI9_9SPHI|nr:hypothetical protein [Pedobacter agri]MCX3266638.1 hypothetical protein [Pedobacter agri]
MKKMYLFIFILIIIILVIDRCTVINLSPKLLFTNYKKFPELNDGLKSDKYAMYRATETANVNIRYFPQNNFFLLSNFQTNGYFHIIKIDPNGENVFELKFEGKDAFKFVESINCFVIGADGIYDFSAVKPLSLPFNEVLNRDKNLAPKEWEQIFEQKYSTADIVLYGWHTDLENAQCVYFRNDGKWTKLYTFLNAGPMYVYAEGSKIECKIKGRKIPHKWHEEHFLKDPARATYSNELRHTDDYITPYNSDFSFFPDQALKYEAFGALKTLAFSKETYTTEGYYNPGIPNTFYGTAYYELNVHNEVFNFKTVGYKHNGIGAITQSDIYLFGLPLNFANKSDVGFLAYDYSTNFHENGKKGIYVIRKK